MIEKMFYIMRKYGCAFCPVRFNNKAKLQMHESIYAKAKKPVICPYCEKSYSKRDFNQASGGSSQLFQFQNQTFPSSSTAPETVSTVPPPASSNYVNFNLSTICPEINFAVPGSDKVQSKLPSRGVMQHAHPHQDPKVGPANFTSMSSTSEMPPVISQGISLLTPSNPSQLSGINHQAKLPAISTSSLPLATMSRSHTATSTSAAMNFHPQ